MKCVYIKDSPYSKQGDMISLSVAIMAKRRKIWVTSE